MKDSGFFEYGENSKISDSPSRERTRKFWTLQAWGDLGNSGIFWARINQGNSTDVTCSAMEFHEYPGVEIETKCHPWDFSSILNVIVTQLSSSDSHLSPISHPVTPGDNWVTMTSKMLEIFNGWHLVSISTSGYTNPLVDITFGKISETSGHHWKSASTASLPHPYT